MLMENIVSERLILRNMVHEDAKTVYQIWSNVENDKYMCDPVDSQQEVETIIAEIECGDGYLAVATLKNTGEIVGTCCFGPSRGVNEWAFGYSLERKFWGNGFATEMVKAVIAFGSSVGVCNFISACAIENSASGKVLQKSGMHIDRVGSFLQPTTNIVYEEHVYKLQLPGTDSF